MTQLGQAVTAVLNATFPEADYNIFPELNGEVAKAQMKEWDRVAKRFGFRNIGHLRNEVERRTSPRWAFYHIPFSF